MNSEYLITREDVKHDPCFEIGILPTGSTSDIYPKKENDSVEIPEILFLRLYGVSQAYSLYSLQLASENLSDRWVYRGAQLETLMTELSFIESLINDEFLKENIALIQQIVNRAFTSTNKLEVYFEGV